MSDLPEFCVHRSVPDLPDITCERVMQGMRVVYRPAGGRAEVGVIEQIKAHHTLVLYLGDRTAKTTRLSDLWFWDGVQ